MLQFLRENDTGVDRLAAVAQTLNMRRSLLQCKSFHVAYGVDDLISALEKYDCTLVGSPSKENPHLFFVFTGQGAQWSKMGQVLIDAFPVARKTLEEFDLAVRKLQTMESNWSLLGKRHNDSLAQDMD